MPRRSKVAFWIGGTILALVVLVGAALGGGYFYLQTESGRRFLVDRVEAAAGSDTMSLEIGRLTGSPTSAFTLHDIVLADEAGPFARVDALAIAWRPLDLLRGRLAVERISATRIDLQRLPPASEPAEPEGDGSQGVGLGIDIAVNRLAIGELRLGEAVAGAPVRLAATGSAALDADGDSARFDLDIRRTDAEGHAALSLDYAARPARFAARAEIGEPAGGELARLLGIPGAPAVSVRLGGTGPPQDWRGSLRATAGETTVSSALSASVGENGLALAAKGEAQAGPLLPAWLAPLVGARASFDAAVRSRPGGDWILERLALVGAAFRVDGSGRYVPDKAMLSGDLVVETRAPLAFPAVAPDLRARHARIAIHADGPVAAPRATAAISARDIASAGIAVGEATADLRLATAASGAMTLDGSLRLAQLDTGNAVPPGVLGDTLTLAIAASGSKDGSATLNRFDVRSGALSASVTGRYAPAGEASGAYRIGLERLGPLADGATLSPNGSVRLAGDFRFDTGRMTGTAGLAGALSDLAPQGTPLAALAGARIPVKAAFERRPDGTIAVSGLDIRASIGRLQGQATFAPTDGTMRGQVELAVPDLAPLSTIAGTDLAGRGRLRIDAEGPIEAIAARAMLRLEAPRAGDVALERIEVDIDARRDGPGVSGSIATTAIEDGRPIPGKLRFAMDADTIRLSDIDLGTGPNRVTGALRIGRGDGLAQGALRARLGNLSALPLPKSFAPTGALDLSLRLARANGQRIALTGNVRDLRLSMGEQAATVGSATISATVDNALAAPRVRGTLRVKNAAFGEAVLTSLALNVRAARTETVSFDGRIDGRYGAPVALSFAGRSTFGGDIRATLTRLDGTVSDVRVAATRPLQAVWRDAANWSGEAGLRIAEGTVSASAARAPVRLDARMDIRNLPLSLVALAAPGVDLEGALSGQAVLAGPPERLGGRVALDLAGVRPRGAGWPAGDKFQLSTQATLGRNGLALSGQLHGPQQTTAALRADTPVRLSLNEGGIAVSADGPLDGTVTVAGQLGLVDALVGLGENRLAGRVEGKIDLGGTVSAPQPKGTIALANGRFESLKTGTTIRDIAATVLFDGTQIRLAGFDGHDAGSGRIRGDGTVGLDAAAGWPVDMHLSFAQFAALARDDATIHASGDLRFRGKAASPRIEGVLAVNDGEIRIPDRLGGGAATLDVVEINAPPGMKVADQAAENRAASPAIAIPLDIAVGIPGRVFVRGRGVDSEWQGKLKIEGTTAEPKIVGDVSVVRGTFAFAGRNFALREGQVTFQGGTPPDPALAVRAVAPIESIEAAIVVSGTASKPKIVLESEPALPNDEILSRILFGKSFGQLNALQAAQLAQSAAQLSGGASGLGVLDQIRRTLGVDVLSVGSQDETVDGATLQAGKYITEDVFVSVDQGTRPGSQKVGVEIELTPNITVETDVGPEAGSSVGLNWKWDY